MITGRCECQRIEFEIDGEITDFSHCHCSQCRRIHGAAYASFGEVKRSNFKLLSGQEDIAVYRSSAANERQFCLVCGANILMQIGAEPDYYYISMGAINDQPSLPLGYHIFVGSKAPWHHIHDDLPQFQKEP
jgi:hypothetical protein